MSHLSDPRRYTPIYDENFYYAIWRTHTHTHGARHPSPFDTFARDNLEHGVNGNYIPSRRVRFDPDVRRWNFMRARKIPIPSVRESGGWLVGWWFREFRRERHLLVTIFLNREQHEPLRATLRRNIFQSDCSGSISDGRVIIASKIEVKKGVHVRLDYLMIHRLYGLFRAVYTAVAPLERCKCEARKGCAEARGHGDTAIATSSTLCTLISGLFDRSWVIVNYV